LTAFGKLRPIMAVCCFIDCIQILLLGMAGDIGDPAPDIGQLVIKTKALWV